MRIEELELRIRQLENKLRNAPKPHVIQGKKFDAIKRGLSNINTSDLEDQYLSIYDDPNDNKQGLIFRYNGKKYKIEATEI